MATKPLTRPTFPAQQPALRPPSFPGVKPLDPGNGNKPSVSLPKVPGVKLPLTRPTFTNDQQKIVDANSDKPLDIFKRPIVGL